LRSVAVGRRSAGDRSEDRPAILLPAVENDPRPHGGRRRREFLRPGRPPRDPTRASAGGDLSGAGHMLTTDLVEHILARLPRLTVGVLGDRFPDRYLDIDGALTEPSIETGLDAYQVVHVRSYPGAAGTIVNNLVALGVGRVVLVAIIGDDGEGHELRQALAA